ncbi:hypothetical protein BVC80_1837g147 [Macleaya cordata]|uniref:NADH-ubiquinone reductase complex 1 MLRQ subunit n=1 Tax=Macleaya cordata TaxID=56857 RepID=A0A200R3P4_MACCD|nr:hypothetical protein BVC80_1837g147 [Macleaya cordata]
MEGEFVPVYVLTGLIVVAGIIGLHTANQQLRYNPAVRLNKKKRETLPEVVDPDHVVEESENFIKKSFFRKVAHLLLEFDQHHAVLPDPIRGMFTPGPGTYAKKK